MAVKGKKQIEARSKVDRAKRCELKEALQQVKSLSWAKFDETVDMAIRLGVDPRKADQMVRGSTVLPHGIGKNTRVLVFAKGEKSQEAQKAGADYIGAEDMVEKIAGGWLDFDKAVATPDMMSAVGKLGKILGPRGLMPNPKSGTVSFDVQRMVKEIKAGKVEFRVDKTANVHVPIGRVSFDVDRLYENARALIEALLKMKPPTSKGQYIRGMVVSSTMGPGIKVDHAKALTELK